MAKILSFKKDPANYVLTDGKKVRLPSSEVLEKLQDAPLLKKHRILIEKFPRAQIK